MLAVVVMPTYTIRPWEVLVAKMMDQKMMNCSSLMDPLA